MRTSCQKIRTQILPAAFLLLGLLGAPLSASGHVLIIKDAEIRPYREAIEGFKRGCGCQTLELDLSDVEEIDKALKQHPAAVVAVGTRAFRKARSLKNISVIYTMVMPSETARPGGSNISGISMEIEPAKTLSTMAALFPGANRIGLLFDPVQSGRFVRRASAAAAEKGLALIAKPLSDPRQVPALLEQIKGSIDILWMVPDSTVVNAETVDFLMLFSFRNNIPIFSFSEKYVEKGAVAALSIDPREMGVQAGETARALLQGGKGPVRAFARNPRLFLNMKVGAKIGVLFDEKVVSGAKNVE